jgi:hypothetical protein
MTTIEMQAKATEIFVRGVKNTGRTITLKR